MKKSKLLTISILGILSLVACSTGSSSNSSSSQSASSSNESDASTSIVTTNETFTENNNTSIINITSSQGGVTSSKPVEVVGDINVTKTGSNKETLYFEWQPVDGATSYNVYYKAENGNFIQIDDMLIRTYESYMRADIVGLKAGTYEVKVIACQNGTETNSSASFTIDVEAHIREGFGWLNGSASGAYNDDGTLKSNAVVVYVTSKNAKTVTATIDGQTYSGFQAILNAKQKTASTTPLDIRVVGTVNADDVDEFGSSSEGIQIKGKSAFSEMNITLEGIGNDATFKGFGVLIRNCKNVEIRNLGFLNFMDDGVSIDTDNSNLWVHNNDFFYGKDGGGDKAKGDGALDTKGSKNITHSFNHFWDSGKCNLQGMKDETSENCITYHHNWFDHSDSRHPRIRTGTVHVYNNYYDGNSKYGVGATMDANAFVEANYFRNCKYPMLISQQGSDIASDPDGTFSGETGGMIKAYNNYMTGQNAFVSYYKNNTEFDAYVASSRDEQVPSTVTAKSGGATYSNFDTATSMYTYNVETPEDAKVTTTTYAGRTEGGDFKWTFSSSDDSSYAVDSELRSAVTNYETTLVSIQGENVSETNQTTSSSSQSSSINSQTSSDLSSSIDTTISDDISHNFTTDGFTSSFFTIVGNKKSNPDGTTYQGLTLTAALKMESSTSISFTISQQMKLTLVFDSGFVKNVKVDGEKYQASDGVVEVTLLAGEHTITKADTANLYYIGLTSI